MSNEEVLSLINAAFAHTIAVPEVRLVSSHELEPCAIKQLLARKSWHEVTADVLIEYDRRADSSAIIAFLSDEANRYFLPSFMFFVLNQGKGAGLIIDVLLSRLAAGRSGLLPVEFTEKQRGAVRCFLRALSLKHSDDESTRVQIDTAIARWAWPAHTTNGDKHDKWGHD